MNDVIAVLNRWFKASILAQQAAKYWLRTTHAK
jgi:hypothetical protein